MSWLGTQSSEPDCMSLKVGFATYQLLVDLGKIAYVLCILNSLYSK